MTARRPDRAARSGLRGTLPRAALTMLVAGAALVAVPAAARAGDAPPAGVPPAPPPPPSWAPPPPPPGTAGAPIGPGAGADPSATPDVDAEAAAAKPAVRPMPPDAQAAVGLVPENVPVVPPPPGALRGMLGLCHPDPCQSPFFRDTDVRLHLRTFYFDRHNVDESINEAWAIGGWLQYTSGWLANVFQVGATGYTSQPLYAPEDHDGTSLLEPGQDQITVLGIAYARFRWCDYAVLTLYRQSVNDGYIGPQDNRMIPNTFEGVTLTGEVGKFEYDVGYLWDMKPRNSDSFLSMSAQAGVAEGDEGVWFGSLTWHPNSCWEVFLGDYYTPDAFNTAFGYVKHSRKCGCVLAEFGVQYTDQRSVDDENLGSFETWNVGVGARVTWDWGLRIGVAAHATGDDANIRSPYGSWPGWLSLIETDFDRANEKAFGVAVRYDFGKRCQVPGLAATVAYARGMDRENPATGAGLADTDEFDLDVTYDVPRVKGLQVRFRNAYVEAGGPDTGWQIRLIVNWEIDLL